jgi:hypothetical protein
MGGYGKLSENQIGVKLADGSFYPVLEQEFTGRKKLVVTTAQDNQDTVQIDLFRSQEGQAEQSGYLGSLVIENISPAPSREPAIDLELDLDPQGNLNATARDTQSGEKQTLSVSLPSLEGGPEEIGELAALEAGPVKAPETESFEQSLLTGETYPIGSTDRRKEPQRRRRVRPLAVLGFVLLGLAIIAGAAYLIWRLLDGRPIPALFAGRSEAPTEMAEPAAPEQAEGAEEAAPEQAPPAAAEQEAPAAQPKAAPPKTAAPAAEQAAGGSEGVWYRIKWGDTLWDLAGTYYRNPWLYPRLAKANKIPNPDLIIAGHRLFIPKY